MSTDWNVHCLDCQTTHRFNDANHLSREVASLCKYASAIALLADLHMESGGFVTLNFGSYGEIDPVWFARHLGHNLCPISEYGTFLDQCTEYVHCKCGSRTQCTLRPGHTEPCSTDPRTP